MRGEPSIELVEEWEQTLDADLLHHLIPTGQLPGMRRPRDVNELPAGAHAALADRIGRHGLEDLLIVPSAERTYGWQRRRCIYAPPCVLGLGERAVALWVQALPAPGIRVLVPLSEIAAIARQANGTRRQLLVTSRTGRLPVRYKLASNTFMDAWTRRLLAVTPRELLILRSVPSANPPGRRADSLYVSPRHHRCRHPVGGARAVQCGDGPPPRAEIQEGRRDRLGVAGTNAQRSRPRRH